MSNSLDPNQARLFAFGISWQRVKSLEKYTFCIFKGIDGLCKVVR